MYIEVYCSTLIGCSRDEIVRGVAGEDRIDESGSVSHPRVR
ncbi:hypothetical protein [uncultured Jatrophihabitans sp.]